MIACTAEVLMMGGALWCYFAAVLWFKWVKRP